MEPVAKMQFIKKHWDEIVKTEKKLRDMHPEDPDAMVSITIGGGEGRIGVEVGRSWLYVETR